MIMNVLLTSAGIAIGVILTYPIAYCDGVDWAWRKWKRKQEPRG